MLELSRKPRGLFNLGGIIHKWIFGTLDPKDVGYFENATETLKKKQQKLVTASKKQISLSKEL